MFFFTLPAALKIVTALALILLVNRITKNLMISILSAILVLVFWIRLPIPYFISIVYTKITALNTIMLLTVIFEIMILSSLMSEIGMMKKLVSAVNDLVSPLFGMAVIPAIIGLLPIPGGAIFSAPLVDDCDEENELDAVLKTRINYWFRHIWEFWWPLYPGVLLAVNLTGISAFIYSLFMSPLTLFSAVGGYFFLLRKVRISHDGKRSSKMLRTLFQNIFHQIYPIVTVVLFFIIMNMIFPDLRKISSYLPMSIAVLFSLALIIVIEKPELSILWKYLFNKKNFELLLLVASILLYGAVIECRLPEGILLMEKVRVEVSSAGIPQIVIIALLPFISGLSTGISVAFVGASFPIVIGLIPQDAAGFQFYAYVMLAAGCGYIGMMLSPVHICLIVTNNYFKSNLAESIIKIIKPTAVIASGIMFLFSIYYFWI